MFSRVSLGLVVSLVPLVFACSSPAEPVAQDPQPVAPPTTLFAADAGTTTSTPVAPIPPVDSGLVSPPITYDAAPPPPPPPPPTCPPGVTPETEPNDTTPNDLTSAMCGVLNPGERDVLRISLQQFSLHWVGNIQVQVAQPPPGQPFIAEIISLTPGVPTPWTIMLGN